MIIPVAESLKDEHPEWSEYWSRFQSSSSLASLVWNVLQLGLLFARLVLEAELATRAKQTTDWPDSPVCGRRYRSKGFVSRRVNTLIGEISWSRRVGRCPNHCPGSSCVPFDGVLGLAPHQKTDNGLKRLGVLLSVMLPYEMASYLLGQWSGIQVSDSTLWNWVQQMGKQASEQMDASLKEYENGGSVNADELDAQLQSLCLAISADGVMAPFRPHPKTPAGKTVYKEVKIGVFARLQTYINTKGKEVTRLLHRRVVAHVGEIHHFSSLMGLEAQRQSIEQAPRSVWICDGGKGFWGLFRRQFAKRGSVAILDFYHAAGHLWKAAKAVFDGRTTLAQSLFEQWRHQLRHGEHCSVLRQLTQLVNTDGIFSDAEMKALMEVQSYFQSHFEHIQYSQFDQQELPLGSGMIESACKWLIQQRFKGTGMRWSDEGFVHLLHLRVLWANRRFDQLFPDVDWAEQLPSPNR
ncbi:MAG: ISKra4 family transposase [Moorea sp. SIO3C2]|nr:ISKra4 family transposase [Moorena sp. SIO3C2]